MEESTNTQQYPIVGIRLKVFLQACYDPATHTMHTDLHKKAGLPANQPYSGSPWFYLGTEALGTNDPQIVDWVLVELYAGGFMWGQAAGLLRSDGNLVDAGGNPLVRIPADKQIPSAAVSDVGPLPADSYYLVVRHRNHLAVRSKFPLHFGQNHGEIIINLSFDPGNCYSNQDYTPTVQMGSTWCLRAGDVNSDGEVKISGRNNDQNALMNDPVLGGSLSSIVEGQYRNQDVNMDGVIKASGPKNDMDFLSNKSLGGSLSKIYKAQL